MIWSTGKNIFRPEIISTAKQINIKVTQITCRRGREGDKGDDKGREEERDRYAQQIIHTRSCLRETEILPAWPIMSASEASRDNKFSI